MRSPILLTATLCAFTGIAFGAFGAHGLKNSLSPAMMEIYKTAVTYQMWHALGLGLIAVFKQFFPHDKLLIRAAQLMFVGIVLFSGSLYLLAIFNVKAFGVLTPFGGCAFLAAWCLFGLFALRMDKS